MEDLVLTSELALLPYGIRKPLIVIRSKELAHYSLYKMVSLLTHCNPEMGNLISPKLGINLISPLISSRDLAAVLAE